MHWRFQLIFPTLRPVRPSQIAFFVCILCYLGFALVYVPRLANPLWSDIEFTGWVSPIAHRIVEGQRIYRDFTLPIPPGSFALLAAFQSLSGRFFLLDELWLCALCQLAMVLIGYALVRPFTTERNAVLAAMATIPALISTPKEIAYDHTALVVAWAALLLLSRGLLQVHGRTRSILLLLAGLAASFTLTFKSSIGIGAVAATLIGVVGMAWVAVRTEGLTRLRETARDVLYAGAGLLIGAAVTLLVVVSLNGSVSEFYQVVFVDGPRLKGGQWKAALNLLSYTVGQTPVHLSFLLALVVALAVVRVARTNAPFLVKSKTQLRLADDRHRRSWGFAVLLSLGVMAIFGFAALLLVGNAPSVPIVLQVAASFGTVGPMIGLFALLLLIVANYTQAGSARDPKAVFAVVGIAAGALSLMHNLSNPTHRPLYDNNPVIPLGIAALLMVFDQARARTIKYVSVCVMLLALFGTKYQRYLIARTPVADAGFWSGLKVSQTGAVILGAALRARDLAGPKGTVLTLPEDPMFHALIGRARPALRGGIVFVDQYPEHVLAEDLKTLRSDPPDVLVLHPDEEYGWNTVYSIWSVDSAAARLQKGFLREHRETTYQVDSAYPTVLFDSNARMIVLKRKDQNTLP